MNYFKRNFLFASAVLFTAFTSAQENEETFTTFKEGGHYFITASINGKPETPIMLESGTPALFVDSAFAVSTGCVDISEYPASDHMMNLNGRKFRITNEGDGKVRIGKHTIYEGPVFLMADYENPYKVAVPIHLLHNEADGGSRIVKVDLANECLQMQSKASLKEADKKGFSSYKITYKTYKKMPAVKSVLKIDEGGKVRTLKGKFTVDLGNAEVLFLVEKNKNVTKFLESNPDMSLQEALAPNGAVVGRYVLTDKCTICDMEFPDALVVVTPNFMGILPEGSIGLKFFMQHPSILDFDKKRMYVK
ncbi:MAG: hypothetical protein IKW84_08000 [Bacteroidaceae bacterium]|nr:hypothetical protein [Bacteroidaceae bacterium]